jgi:hypothetical protein
LGSGPHDAEFEAGAAGLLLGLIGFLGHQGLYLSTPSAPHCHGERRGLLVARTNGMLAFGESPVGQPTLLALEAAGLLLVLLPRYRAGVATMSTTVSGDGVCQPMITRWGAEVPCPCGGCAASHCY